MDMWNFTSGNRRPIPRPVYYAVFAFVFLLMVEGRAYLMLCAGYAISVSPESSKQVSAALIDRPAAVYDAKTGYRWLPGPTRIIRTFNGEVIFDNRFRANAQGYISHRDYVGKKERGTFRVAILGDSFTAATYLKKSWPEIAEQRLQKEFGQVELYSFAIDGAGVTNWNRIFFQEILPHYEFDLLVVASGRGHLDKEFFSLKSMSKSIWAATEEKRPELGGQALPLYRKILDIASDPEMDDLHRRPRRWRWASPDWSVTRHLVTSVIPGVKDRVWQKVAGVSPSPVAERSPASIRSDWEVRYGREHARAFFSILDECRQRKLPVVITAVPGRDDYLNFRRYGGKPEDVGYLERIARAEGLGFFDAYSVFPTGNVEETVKKYWLKYDAHWNEEGATLFGQAFANHLVSSLGKAR